MALRVAVVGAGAAGLVALRHLTRFPDKFKPIAYEMTSNVSGTWVYTDNIGKDELGLPVHSSMYKNLKTNLPKEVMAFPDYPFPKSLPSFVTHEDVRSYLEGYAEHFKLKQHIKFSTRVDSITPHTVSVGQCEWEVESSNVQDPNTDTETEKFDAVIICNGHYAIPLVPDIPGLDSFTGRILHSHSYREPSDFTGRTVAILGAAASGQDIALDIATRAKHVYLLHNKPVITSRLPDNITQGVGISLIDGKKLTINDGSQITADVLMYCTGYRYDFSFVRQLGKLTVEDERVTPLYKHIIHTVFPSLSVIGLCKTVCPFPQFHCQVLFVLAALSGEMDLPSRQDMEDNIEKDFNWRRQERGMPVRHAHTMGPLQWEYNDDLANLAGFTPIPPVVRTLYDHVHNVRVHDLPGYKNTKYELLNDKEFQVT